VNGVLIAARAAIAAIAVVREPGRPSVDAPIAVNAPSGRVVGLVSALLTAQARSAAAMVPVQTHPVPSFPAPTHDLTHDPTPAQTFRAPGAPALSSPAAVAAARSGVPVAPRGAFKSVALSALPSVLIAIATPNGAVIAINTANR
jgi:hypothetical protein